MIALTLLPGGCATSALWDGDRFARFHEPATSPNLRLAYCVSAQDVLVQYDEACDEKTSSQRRAYFLYGNRQRIEARRKPRFVQPSKAVGLVPIRVLESPCADGAPAVANLHAVVSTNNQPFTLYTNEVSLGSFDLPVYADASGRTKQVLLTPITVTADLTIVGGYLFLLAWSTGQLYWVH
jgi:hypothetical protein